jgi:hypothetical protein
VWHVPYSLIMIGRELRRYLPAVLAVAVSDLSPAMRILLTEPGAVVVDAAPLAAAGVAGAAAGGWLGAFCTRLRNCDPLPLAGAWGGDGGVGSGRAVTGNAVMLILSSEGSVSKPRAI